MRFKVTDYCVKTRKSSRTAAGEEQKPLRITLLADLHCKVFGKNNEKLYSAIRDSRPDIIVIAGDLVNGLNEEEFGYAREFLGGLCALGIPVYYGFGNHETKFTLRANNLYDRYISLIEETECILMRNSNIAVRDGITLYGLEMELRRYNDKYGTCDDDPDLTGLLGTPDPGCFNILIAHTPEYEKLYYEWGADLVLSGHNHGGLIRLPFIGGIISPRLFKIPEHDRGIYSDGEHDMILSAGLGWHGFPFRFRDLPEVVNITLESEE